MPSLSRRLALMSLFAMLLAFATCGYSSANNSTSDYGRISIAIHNATIHDALLKDARDGTTLGRIYGGAHRCIRVTAYDRFTIVAYAISGVGLSPHRITTSPPIDPGHSDAWDWRITSFATPETGPLLPAKQRCADKRA